MEENMNYNEEVINEVEEEVNNEETNSSMIGKLIKFGVGAAGIAVLIFGGKKLNDRRKERKNRKAKDQTEEDETEELSDLTENTK